jgi:hypothetical protein
VRHNTVVCSFDPSSPRITEYEIHEWIHAAFWVQESKVRMIPNGGIKRDNFIKFVDKEYVNALFRDMPGRAEYKYPNRERSIVNIEVAGMGTKHTRVANLPPEVSMTLYESLASFGKVLNTYAETWSTIYRYPVSNGVRQVVMHLTRHLPSNLTTAGHSVLISCEGQPATCYGCGQIGHLCQACPARQATGTERQVPPKTRTHPLLKSHTIRQDNTRHERYCRTKRRHTATLFTQQRSPSHRIGRPILA